MTLRDRVQRLEDQIYNDECPEPIKVRFVDDISERQSDDEILIYKVDMSVPRPSPRPGTKWVLAFGILKAFVDGIYHSPVSKLSATRAGAKIMSQELQRRIIRTRQTIDRTSTALRPAPSPGAPSCGRRSFFMASLSVQRRQFFSLCRFLGIFLGIYKLTIFGKHKLFSGLWSNVSPLCSNDEFVFTDKSTIEWHRSRETSKVILNSKSWIRNVIRLSQHLK